MRVLFFIFSFLHTFPAERTNSAVLDTLTVDAETEVEGKPVNDPSTYLEYVKPMVEGIIAGSASTQVSNYDKNDNKIADGKVVVALAGICPSTFCNNQAIYIAQFGSSVISYWAKPGDILECTKSRHVKKGKCKNDSDKFTKLDAMIQGGKGSYKIKDGRLVLMNGSTELYVYMLYINTWSTFSGTLKVLLASQLLIFQLANILMMAECISL